MQKSKARLPIQQAFPLMIHDEENSLKVQARYQEESKGKSNFQCNINDKNFFAFPYFELEKKQVEGFLRQSEEHDFSGQLKKSTFKILNAE